MKRIVAVSTITGYLAVLLVGLCAHALNYKASSHPGMYFLVWDMFCGWSAYEDRTHIIGQGESGRFYELAPGPWGDYQPFGDPGRQNYDPFANHSVTLAMNTLRYSEHEPMHRIYVVQETWDAAEKSVTTTLHWIYFRAHGIRIGLDHNSVLIIFTDY